MLSGSKHGGLSKGAALPRIDTAYLLWLLQAAVTAGAMRINGVGDDKVFSPYAKLHQSKESGNSKQSYVLAVAHCRMLRLLRPIAFILSSCKLQNFCLQTHVYHNDVQHCVTNSSHRKLISKDMKSLISSSSLPSLTHASRELAEDQCPFAPSSPFVASRLHSK